MQKKWIAGLILMLAMALLMAGCGVSAVTPPPVQVDQENNSETTISPKDQLSSVSQVASAYLASDKIKAMTPEQLYRDVFLGMDPQYILVDIRSSSDFMNANIYGSLNIPYNQTASSKKLAQLPKDKTLIVIDYNGHWAAQTAATWNLLGYQAVPLLYGLQGWTQEAAALGYDSFPAEPLEYPLDTRDSSLEEYSMPEVMSAAESVEECIRQNTASYLDRNYKGLITAEDLLAAVEGADSRYFLVDIRDPQHYRQGHIAGAVNIPLAKLATVEMLKYLPPDKKIVLIGYDGLDASQGVRVLVTMNYDAVALKYGMAYWNGNQEVTGASPLRSLVHDEYQLVPLNYMQPSTGAASCG